MRKEERVALTQGVDVGACLLWIIKFTATLRRPDDEQSREYQGELNPSVVEQFLALAEAQAFVSDDLGVVRKYHYVMPVPGNLPFTGCFHDALSVLESQESGNKGPRSRCLTRFRLTPCSRPVCPVDLQPLSEIDVPCFWNIITEESPCIAALALLRKADKTPGSIFVAKGERQIGSRYKKAVYREYTDDTFRTQRERQTDQEHLGIMGPIIRAEVGEQILITFRNNASRPYSIYAHGIETNDIRTPVEPGFMTEFRWDVPEWSGPGLSDPNCISYVYYSPVDYVKDLYSGLLGPLVVCRKGTLSGPGVGGAGGDRRRTDAEREFALLFLVFDENQSWYLEDNIRTYLNTSPDNFTSDESFTESNLMHGINGKLYGNLKGLAMTSGELVDWYLLGMGNEQDMHTVHFHAETFTYKTDHIHRADVFDLFPGTFQTIEMVAANPGTWLLHCHVSDHIHAGMETTFTIRANSSSGCLHSISTLLLCLALGLVGTVSS